MSDQTSKLTVEIAQVSKGSGISDTARDLKGLAGSAAEADRAARANAKGVAELAGAAGDGANAGRVLSSALHGNIDALGQMGPLIKGLSTLLKTNIIGAMITIGALAASFAAPFVKGWLDTKDATKKAADELKRAEQAATDAKKSAEELGKAQMDILLTNLETIRRTAAEAEDSFKGMQARAQQIDDAQRAVDLLKIDADANSTEEQKVIKRAFVNSTFDARRASRPIAAAEFKAATAGKVLEGARSQEAQANDQVLAAQARVNELAARRSEAEGEEAKLRAAYIKRQEEILRTTFAGTERQFLSKKNRDETVAKATNANERLKILNSKEGIASEAQAGTALKEATQRRDAANGQSQKAEADLAKAASELAAAREQLTNLIPLITEAAKMKTAADAAVARERDIAAGRGPAPAAPVAPAPVIATVTNTARPVNPNDPAQAARDRASALASVAGGQAAAVSGDARNAPGLQILGDQAKAAADEVQKNPSLENIAKLIELMTALNQGQTEIANKLRMLESQIKTARTR